MPGLTASITVSSPPWGVLGSPLDTEIIGGHANRDAGPERDPGARRKTKARQSLGQHLQRDLHVDAGEGGSDAQMRPPAEPQVWHIGLTGDVKCVRVLAEAPVPVG